MNNIKRIIESAATHIGTMHQGNLVIGGMHALRLHGLVMHREPSDLDIVVYQPTKEQLQYLAALCDRAEVKEDDENYRSYKVESNGFVVDFLLETGENMPSNLLGFSHLGFQFFVQSVEGVISAKRCYNNADFQREKDITDCESLKANNFNLGLK